MKKHVALICSAALALGTAGAFADDVRIDQAQALVSNGTITDTELEQEYGKYVYKVEIRDADGAEWDVDLDAANGEILKSERDH